MVKTKQTPKKRRFQIKSIRTKVGFAVAVGGLLLMFFSLWLLKDSMTYLEHDLIDDRLEADIRLMRDVLGETEGKTWRREQTRLYIGDTLIGDGTEHKANESPFYHCEEITGTFFYSFVRTDNDSELTWVGDQKTGYQQGHYFRTAGTTKGLDGVSSIVGTYMSKNVADVLDAIGVYSGEANVNGRMIYCRYETLCDEAGEIVGAVVVGRSIEEMNDIVNKQSIRSFILQIVILAMISLGLGVIVSSLLSGLEKIKDYLRRIGEGTFPAEPLRVATGDELEQVSDSVNGMVDSLKEKERIGAELSVATDIQANMLPRIFPPFPEHGEFDLYATMDPAREVGGDFYDFFLLDESHLAVVIADVSGKGVPAALFMVIAKTLIKNQAQMGNSPAEVFTKVNQLLCEGNETGLFVTAWMAILDTKTGTLSFSNAGHNPPMLLHEGEFTFLRSKPGLVLAGMEGIRYRQQELKLSPGDKLFLYTDGVTEATDADETLYGEARLSAYLNAHREQSPQMLLAGLRKDMDTFVGEAEQFDDITMLLLEYRGQ